jgi:hypothetical protein
MDASQFNIQRSDFEKVAPRNGARGRLDPPLPATEPISEGRSLSRRAHAQRR